MPFKANLNTKASKRGLPYPAILDKSLMRLYTKDSTINTRKSGGLNYVSEWIDPYTDESASQSTDANQPKLTDDFDGRRVKFDGEGDYLKIRNSPNSLLAEAIKASFVFSLYVPDFSSRHKVWVLGGTISGNIRSNFIETPGTGDQQLRVFLRDAEGNTLWVETEDNSLLVDTWHHIAILWGGGNDIDIYIDTSKQTLITEYSESPTSIPTMDDGEETLGASDKILQGFVDGFSYWKDLKITENDIEKLYSYGI